MFGLTQDDIKRVLWTAIQAFLGALIVIAPGVLAAPNLSEAKALATAGLAAAVAAALSVLKNALLQNSAAK